MVPADSSRPDSAENVPPSQPDAQNGTPGQPQEPQPAHGTLLPVPVYHPGYAAALVPASPPGLSG